MKRKIGIIGIGNVGSATALAIIEQNICDELILVDKNLEKAKAHALDMIDMLAYTTSYTHIIATDELSLLHDADLIINSIGPTSELKEDRLEELNETADIVSAIFPPVMSSGFAGIILNITNPCDVITQLIQNITGLPKTRVFGTGTALDTARLQRVVSQCLDVSPVSVHGYMLGEHGESQFAAWSTLHINSFPFLDFPQIKDIDLDSLEDSVRKGGWEILLGKGHTNFGVAKVAATIANEIFTNSHRVLPISTYHEELACYIGTPAILTNVGIKENLYPILPPEEQKKLVASATIIKNAYSTLTHK